MECFGKELLKILQIIQSVHPELETKQSENDAISDITKWVISRKRLFDQNERKALTQLLFHLHNLATIAPVDLSTTHNDDVRQLIFLILSTLPLEDEFIGEGHFPNESLMQLKVGIGLKLAKDYIDDGHSAKEADLCLKFVEEVLLFCLKRAGESVTPKIRLLHRQLFVCYLYHAEYYVGVKCYEEARNLYAKVQDRLNEFGDLRQYASHMCFNAGLISYRHERYEEGVHWLRQSFNAGQLNCKSEDKSQILLLLANVYLSWNAKLHWKKAVGALDMIENSNNYWEANFLKLRANIDGNAPAHRIMQVATLCHRGSKDFSFENALTVTNLLVVNHHKEIASQVLKEMINKFEQSRDPNVETLIEHELQLLLSDVVGKDDIAEVAIRRYISRKQLQLHKISWKLVDNIRGLLETTANSFKKTGKFERAIVWFNFCIDLQSSEATTNHYYQQICSCNIEMKRYDDASFALKSIENLKQNDLIDSYLKLQLCIVGHLDENINPILEAITCHFTSENVITDTPSVSKDQVYQLILGLAEFALKQGKDQVALEILESQVSKTRNSFVQLAVLKCIFKLKVNPSERATGEVKHQWLTAFAAVVRDCIQKCKTTAEDDELVTRSGKWFAKILWSAGQQCFNEDLLFGYTLLRSCNNILLESCDVDYSVYLQRQVFLLLAVSFVLEFIRKKGIIESPKKLLKYKETLDGIEECKTLSASLNESPHSNQLASMLASSRQRLLVFEFEAQLLLKPPEADSLLERATYQLDVDATTFEKFAAVLSLQDGDHYLLMVRSLRAAIQRRMKISPPNYPHVLSLYRSLCHVIVAKMEGNTFHDKDFGNLLKELVQLIKEVTVQERSQTEVFWFVTKAWNSGIQRLLYDRSCSEAHSWCQVAIDLVEQIPTLNQVYKAKMMSMFDNVKKPDGAHGDCAAATRF